MDKVKVTVRLSNKEHDHLKKQANLYGLKMEPYIRKLIAGKEVKPRPPEEYYKILTELNHIGNNINQIARVANAQRHITTDKINEAVKMVDDVMDIVRSW
jgi:hypothetical protein